MSVPFSSLDVIPAFVAVMRQGSLSAAARALKLAQPTVRRHIEALETELGARLFTRAVNGLTPTDLARDLLPRAEAVLSEAAALHRVASDQSAALSGSVRVSCARVVASHVLPLALQTLDAPDLTVEIAATDRAEDLLRRAADIAIRFVAPRQAALRVQKMPDVALGFYAAPALAAQAKDFAAMPFISDDRDGLIEPGLRALGVPVPARVVLRSDDALSQIAAIEAGLGVGITQCGLAARKGLVRLLPEVTHHMPCWLVMHEDQAGVPRVRAVFDHLRAVLPGLL